MVGENQKNSGSPVSARQLQTLLSSPEGKTLMQLLKKDGGKLMQEAASALRQGDAETAKTALSKLLSEDEAKALGDGLRRQL